MQLVLTFQQTVIQFNICNVCILHEGMLLPIHGINYLMKNLVAFYTHHLSCLRIIDVCIGFNQLKGATEYIRE